MSGNIVAGRIVILWSRWLIQWWRTCLRHCISLLCLLWS